MNILKALWYTEDQVFINPTRFFHCTMTWGTYASPEFDRYSRARICKRAYNGGPHYPFNPSIIKCFGANWDQKRGVLFL